MFNDTDTTEIYTDRHPRSLHDARPICPVGLEPEERFDVVIGSEENLATWEQYLLSWPNPASRMLVYDDGTIEDLGRVQDDVNERVRVNNPPRARLALRQQFGALDATSATLTHPPHPPDEHDDQSGTRGDTGEAP